MLSNLPKVTQLRKTLAWDAGLLGFQVVPPPDLLINLGHGTDCFWASVSPPVRCEW